jgi:hypothetical protein
MLNTYDSILNEKNSCILSDEVSFAEVESERMSHANVVGQGNFIRINISSPSVFWSSLSAFFTDVDRRMLSQIVERWGGLSDELKRAVLRVVGSGR